MNEAYDVLKDDQKRAAYDQFGHEAFEGGMGGGQGRKGLHQVFQIYLIRCLVTLRVREVAALCKSGIRPPL